MFDMKYKSIQRIIKKGDDGEEDGAVFLEEFKNKGR